VNKPSVIPVTFKNIKRCILEKNPSSVQSVVKLSVVPEIFKYMKDLIGQKKVHKYVEFGNNFT
jgi:hypothetical protein